MTKMTFPAVALACALGVGSSGCIKQILVEGQIEGTLKGSAGVETLSDYEVANTIAFAGIGQFEGMHVLAPDSENALFGLTKTWTSATFAFIEDQMEQAEDAEGTSSELYLYQQARAKAGYDRAVHYGIEMLEMKNRGFDAAKKNDDTMKAWLAGFDDADHDAKELFWTGYAWISRVNITKEDPASVAELFIGVAMIERVIQLDSSFFYGNAHTILGAYHARSPMAELEDGKKEIDTAMKISEGKLLMPKFQLAAKYYCMKSDKANYVKTLQEIIDAGDIFPAQRLTNAIAKRKAKRYLGKERMKSCGF
ncbi:MAG: TRAP transporter TatT component family protein [Byssovorax sp.]